MASPRKLFLPKILMEPGSRNMNMPSAVGAGGVACYDDCALQELRKEIEELKSATHNGLYTGAVNLVLSQRQQDYKRIQRRYRNITVKLPPELLVHIIIMVQDSMGRRDTTRHCELLISHVNRQFREVALGNARLWTNITIYPATRIDCLEAYLARSRASDLKIFLRCLGPASEEHFYAFLIPHLHRICHLDAESASSFALRLIADIPLPRLRFLSIGEISAPHSQLPTSILTRGAPVLSTIHLRNTAHQYTLPLVAVTTLYITDIGNQLSSIVLARILSACPALEHLSIDGCPRTFTASERQTAIRRIYLPQLRTLRLSRAHVLSALEAPALESLVLVGLDPSELTALSPAAYPALTALTITSDTAFRRKCIRMLYGYGEGVVWKSMLVLKSICDLVAARKAMLQPLRKLRLRVQTRSPRSEAYLDWLRANVDDVEFT